jgi:hypothetical protein
MDRQPLAQARSRWESFDPPADLVRDFAAMGASVETYRRRVGDGALSVIVTRHPEHGYQMSISFMDHRQKLSRYPRWDEIADARYTLLPEELDMCMRLPPSDQYVALHDTTFQLVQHNRPDGA